MNRTAVSLFAVVLLGLLVSCQKSPYPGFKKMGDGVYMKYYTKAKGNSEKPRVNDGVTFEVAQYLGDSLIFTTAGGEPIKTIVDEPDFVGDVADALTLMHVGVSVGIVTV